MTKIFFMLNDEIEFNFEPFLVKYLSLVHVEYGTILPSSPADYKLIILWNIRKIIAPLPNTNNVILFHGSDLPRGRGWAPIYYAIANSDKHYAISGIFAASEVDTGDIIIKAKFPIRNYFTASDLRRFDTELSIKMVAMILERFEGRDLVGLPQSGLSTFRKRRYPQDNKVCLTARIEEIVTHLRACEQTAPAYFEIDGSRFIISISSDKSCDLPTDVEFTFGEDLL